MQGARHSVSVAAAIFDDTDSNVLLIQRRDNSEWQPPGGVLELNESLEEGLRREVREETGAEIHVGPLTGAYKNMDLGVVALVFRAKLATAPAQASSEASDIRWVSVSDVASYVAESFKQRISDAREIPFVVQEQPATVGARRSNPLEVTPLLSRPGRPFKPTEELLLAPELRAAASRLRVRHGQVAFMIPESPLPLGVPDMTTLIVDPARLAARIQTGVEPLLSQQDARIVSLCSPRRPTSFARISSGLGVSAPHARARLRGLVSRGALIAVDRDHWMRLDAIEPLGRTYAIEAKTRDWRAGLSQCLRYGNFADAAGLVLGTSSRSVVERATAACADNGVGLFVDGRWLVNPRIARLPVTQRLWLSEHLVASLSDHAGATE